MCVRCGTGLTAACTSPNGHAGRSSRPFTGAAVDCDGDIWGLRAGSDLWECVADDPGIPARLTLAELEGSYGPLLRAGQAASAAVRTCCATPPGGSHAGNCPNSLMVTGAFRRDVNVAGREEASEPADDDDALSPEVMARVDKALDDGVFLRHGRKNWHEVTAITWHQGLPNELAAVIISHCDRPMRLILDGHPFTIAPASPAAPDARVAGEMP